MSDRDGPPQERTLEADVELLGAVPYAQGRALAAAIPGATLIPLEGSAHLPWAGDAQSVARALRSFLAPDATTETAEGEPAAALLSRREREVLALVADGLSEREIAEQLVLSRRRQQHPTRRLHRGPHVAAVVRTAARRRRATRGLDPQRRRARRDRAALLPHRGTARRAAVDGRAGSDLSRSLLPGRTRPCRLPTSRRLAPGHAPGLPHRRARRSHRPATADSRSASRRDIYPRRGTDQPLSRSAARRPRLRAAARRALRRRAVPG